MVETLTVSLSGPAFSFLLYENVKCTFSQEGFLLGEIIEEKTRTITDNDQQQEHISRIIKINSSVPCPELRYFYDSCGTLDVSRVRTFLGDLTTRVVAWYKYRSSSSFPFTFRERLIHKQLAELFKLPDLFSYCLLRTESSDNGSTHSFSQNFVRLRSGRYEQLPLHIVNLSDANNMYKSPERVSETFSRLLEGLKIDHKETQGLTIITKIQNALQKYTTSIIDELSDAEKKMFHLESEINSLKENSTSASDKKETQLNEVILMDTNDTEVSPVDNSPKKNTFKRTPSATTKAEKKININQCGSAKSSKEDVSVYNTRSRKKN